MALHRRQLVRHGAALVGYRLSSARSARAMLRPMVGRHFLVSSAAVALIKSKSEEPM